MQKAETKSTGKKEKALLIVESPAKSKTIKKILGDSFQIEASYGHVRNLPTNTLGFDVNNNFKPTFEIIPEKKAVVKKLNELAKKADKVYLASDPDREGEAIAWHVRQQVKLSHGMSASFWMCRKIRSTELNLTKSRQKPSNMQLSIHVQ